MDGLNGTKISKSKQTMVSIHGKPKLAPAKKKAKTKHPKPLIACSELCSPQIHYFFPNTPRFPQRACTPPKLRARPQILPRIV